MLHRLIECENRLLKEQKHANDLLIEIEAANADELTRMKIEAIQREMDLLGKQLAVMRDAVQQAREPQPRILPQQGKAGQEPRILPQQGKAGQEPRILPQQGKAGQEPRILPQQGSPQPQILPQQAVYRQSAPKRDLEKTFGEAILPICASVLIFFSFIFFAAVVLPYLNNTVKMILMYAVSFVITLTGGLLLARDGRNKGFVALAGCGMGALYLSLMLSNIYFRALGDVALYIGLLLWAAVVCVMSKLRSNSFLIIGQIGVNLSVLLGAYLCTETQDAGKTLFLIVYTLLTQMVFYISHLQKSYNRNTVNHIGWCVGLILLGCGVNERYLKGTLAGGVSAILLILFLCALIVLSMTYFRTDEKKSVGFGILNTLYIWTVYALAAYHFEPVIHFEAAAPFMIVIAALLLIALEFRIPGEKHTGKVIFQCALFFQMLLAWMDVAFLKEYVSVSLLAAVCLFYGFCCRNRMYKIVGLVYTILFVIVSMNGLAQLFWGLVLAVSTTVLLRTFRDQYRTWMKVTGYLLFLVVLFESLERILSETLWDTWVQKLLVLSVITAVNIVMAKVPALRRNLSGGEEEQGIRIATGVVQILLMLYCCVCIFGVDGAGFRLWAVLIGTVLVCTNSVSLVVKEKSEGLSVYVGIKLLVFALAVLDAYEVPGFLLSLAGLVIAAACIVFGFAAGRLLGKNLKGIRIYGLVVVMLCIVKLLLFDIHFERLLFRAAGLFVSGVLCFGISMLYHLVNKRFMENKNEI